MGNRHSEGYPDIVFPFDSIYRDIEPYKNGLYRPITSIGHEFVIYPIKHIPLKNVLLGRIPLNECSGSDKIAVNIFPEQGNPEEFITTNIRDLANERISPFRQIITNSIETNGGIVIECGSKLQDHLFRAVSDLIGDNILDPILHQLPNRRQKRVKTFGVLTQDTANEIRLNKKNRSNSNTLKYLFESIPRVFQFN